MNKLILALGLSISMSANAWTTIDEDTIVGYSSELETLDEPMTFKDVEDRLKRTQPGKIEWCKLKGGIAAGIINDREEYTAEEILTVMAPTKQKIPHFMWVDLQRMVNESRRVKPNGDWQFEDTDDNKIELIISEYQHCIVNGF